MEKSRPVWDKEGPRRSSFGSELPVDWRQLVTPALREQFQRDGVIFLKKVLHPDWLLLIEMGLERILQNGGQAKYKFFEGRDDEFIETIRNMEVAPEIETLIYYSPIADILGEIIGSENVWYYADEFFIKPRGGCGRTPWHQDTPYWPVKGQQIASMWIPLDPLPKQDCLEYIPGSHHDIIYDGFDPREVSRDTTIPYFGEEYPPLPNIEEERSKWDIVSWDIEPGDVILAHPSVLHGGGQTSPGNRRRALAVRCFGDDVVYDSRPSSRPFAPPAPGLDQLLNPGDPLRGPWYPRLRPLPAHKAIT